MRLVRSCSSLVLLGVFALSGCDATSPSAPLILTPLVTSNTVGQHSGVVDRRAIVVNDQQSLNDLWAQIHRNISSAEPVPTVDFSRELVVGFAMGERPSSGFAIRIREATRDRGTIVIGIEETTPAPGCALLPVITAPIDLAKLPRTGENLRFDIDATVKGC